MRQVVLLTALLLAGCGTPPAANTAEPANIAEPANAAANMADEAAGNATATVQGLPDAQRRAVFLRAIRDAGLDCQEVTTAEQISAPGEAPQWRAHCEDGTMHLINVTPDGTAHIVSRTTNQ
jgi:hypothetical protein